MSAANNSFNRTFNAGRPAGRPWLLALVAALFAAQTGFAVTITNVTAVNVTPNGFSVVWSGTPLATPSLSVFADANGVTNLAGQLGIENYPLHSGDPGVTNAYGHLSSIDHITLQMQALGLAHMRVTGGTPGATYYYQVRASTGNGQQTAVWPPSGPFPAVKLAQETSFVLDSQQIVITLPGGNPTGSIITLANPNTPSILAAVVGDGAGTNQAFFNLGDFLVAAGTTNYLPTGSQNFTAKVLGVSTNVPTQTYSVVFPGGFVVGQSAQFNLGSYVALSLGSLIVPVGVTSSIPILLNASTTITNFTFSLDLPTNRFSSLSIQASVPQLGLPKLQSIGSNTLRITLPALPGQNLLGSQQIAQLNFVTYSNQPSAFIPLFAQALAGRNADNTVATNLFSQPGRVVLIGQEALLETTVNADATRELTIYGNNGASYVIQTSTNLADPAAWTDYLTVPMTGLTQVISDLDTNADAIFYRAYSFMADPPLVQTQPPANGKVSLIAYGQPGKKYALEYSTDASASAKWYPLLHYTLTNSFQSLSNVAPTNQMLYFRVQEP